MAEVDAPLVLLAPAVRTGQGCGSCPWAGGTNPMCKSNVCAGGELPPWPQGRCLAAGAVPPVAARAQQWCGTSARGCSRATGAHPRAIPGKAAVGQELAADLPNPAGPSAAPYLCSARGSMHPFGEGRLSLPASPGDTQPCAHEAILRARFRACSGPQSLSREERGAVSCTDSGVFSRSIW